tara:strand:+ start:266 stop:418 length:153 start_codon:yes stop_codon:yes gene_type:complete
MKKLIILTMFLSIASCSSIKEKSSGLKKIGEPCPPKGERTLKDIFCKEDK